MKAEYESCMVCIPEQDPWERRKLIARSDRVAYGKLCRTEAGFISKAAVAGGGEQDDSFSGKAVAFQEGIDDRGDMPPYQSSENVSFTVDLVRPSE